MMMDDKGRPIKVDGCSPTDELGYVFFADGMRRRLGDHAVPSVALLDQHVCWSDKHMEVILTKDQQRPRRNKKFVPSPCSISSDGFDGYVEVNSLAEDIVMSSPFNRLILPLKICQRMLGL
jgi:hypothetical protein